MPSLIDFRRRIRSVKNTQQITKAMKMVSAAKLRRAQESVIAARPYANSLKDMLGNVAAASKSMDVTHPLLMQRPEKNVQVILITADRGLAGALNTNLIRGAQKFMDEKPGIGMQLEAIGRKGRDHFKKRGVTITGEHYNLTKKCTYEDTKAIAQSIIARYANAEVDAVYLIFNEFKSVMTQKLDVRRLLPIVLPEGTVAKDYIYEQPAEKLLSALLPRYVEVELYKAVLESTAAEHAARMTAMDSASSNAADVIERLTLVMNRVRQASITREIIEVVSGASALE